MSESPGKNFQATHVTPHHLLWSLRITGKEGSIWALGQWCASKRLITGSSGEKSVPRFVVFADFHGRLLPPRLIIVNYRYEVIEYGVGKRCVRSASKPWKLAVHNMSTVGAWHGTPSVSYTRVCTRFCSFPLTHISGSHSCAP